MGTVSEKKYFDADTAYDSGTLHNWYIDSVSDNDSPVWTEEHIDELINDFYIIPRDTKPADVAPAVHGRWILSTDMTYMPQCSNCGRHPFKGYIPSIEEVKRVYKHCPVCGTKMDESEDNDNA